MSHSATGFADWFQSPVRPEIAAADAGAAHGHNSIGLVDELGVGDLLDTNIPSGIHDSSAHGGLALVSGEPEVIESAARWKNQGGRSPPPPNARLREDNPCCLEVLIHDREAFDIVAR